MSRVNKFIINLKINIPPGEAGKPDMNVIAEIMRQVQNGLLLQLAQFPQFPPPTEVQLNRFIQSNQHISIKSSETFNSPYQPTTDLSKTLKWGEAEVQALQADYDFHEYQCLDEVYIPGTNSSYRSNRVLINGNEIKMADYLFILFLRLVAELKKGNGGWVNIHSLAEDDIISDVNKYQIYGNLRAAIQGSLMGKNGRKFIQGNGSKNYRISTHPDLIAYDKEKLLRHPSGIVRRLAGELL